MSDDISERRSRRILGLLFVVIAALIALDLLLDYGEGADWRHVGMELAVLLTAALGLLLLWLRLDRTRADLADARGEAEQWRRQNQATVRGLALAIEGQFRDWGLSAAEADIGFLLLKGLSHREIAELRGTSERTVREQSRALYRKAGLTGRSSLSAFFLEDLLPPQAD